MMNKFQGRGKKILIFPLLALAFVAAASAIVLALWNNVLVEVMSVKSISFWQAAGIFLLCKILFGNFKRGGGGPFMGNPNWRDKIRNMSDEDKERFRSSWRERCRKK